MSGNRLALELREVPPPELSIVIVNWNSRKFLHDCLASVRPQLPDLVYEIIVVDSGSFDGCDAMLRNDFPQVRFIQSSENIGFARANNLGARSAHGSVLLFLNPDTEVCGNAVGELYRQVTSLPRAGMVGCRLLNTDGSLQASCVQPIPTIMNQLLDVEFLQDRFPRSRLWLTARKFEGESGAIAVEAVSGACMIVRREVFERVNGFSTDYFMYGEDIDLCWKCHAAGLTNYYLPSVQIVHHGGGSTQRQRSRFADVMIPESVSRLLRKTRGAVYAVGYRLALTAAACVRLAALMLWLPYAALRARTREWMSVFAKWAAILRWGMGFEKWASGSRSRD